MENKKAKEFLTSFKGDLIDIVETAEDAITKILSY